MKISSRKNRGFTLIELLVVISIISLLSSIILSSLQSARSKARDAQRIQTLRQMVTALRLYADTSGHYPITTYNGNTWFADCWQATNWMPDNGAYTWSSGYISAQSHDPVNVCMWPWSTTAGPATYAYWSDGTSYALAARMENASRYDIQHAGTKWVDGNPLYSFHGWNAQTYAIVNQ
ncbi:MAG: hypothetical protein JWN89_317 [Parcubacteria group bacterium]|nr:hypothetical protein [Parcubacteria group bacterium]